MSEELLAAEETPSLLLPATYDILWGTVSFLILLWLFGRFVLPSFKRVVAERAERIEGGLENARQAQAEAARTRAAYEERLESATKEAAAIRSAAHTEGDQILAAARSEAVSAADAVAVRAQAQLAAERASVVGSIQREVGDLALDLASRIVGESLADDRRARDTVDRFIAELEASAAAKEAGR